MKYETVTVSYTLTPSEYEIVRRAYNYGGKIYAIEVLRFKYNALSISQAKDWIESHIR